MILWVPPLTFFMFLISFTNARYHRFWTSHRTHCKYRQNRTHCKYRLNVHLRVKINPCLLSYLLLKTTRQKHPRKSTNANTASNTELHCLKLPDKAENALMSPPQLFHLSTKTCPVCLCWRRIRSLQSLRYALCNPLILSGLCLPHLPGF